MLAVAPIPVGARLIDTIQGLGPTDLRALKDAGVDGVIAYLGGNLTPELLANAGALKLGVVPVNFSRGEGWMPSAALGEADAAASVRRLAALGVPLQGLDDWCDVEGCGGDPTEYCRAWCAIVAGDGVGRRPKVYAGAGALLTGRQWYLLPFAGYWHACSRGVPEPDCGFQRVQLYPPNQRVGGVELDFNADQRDFAGRGGSWLYPG